MLNDMSFLRKRNGIWYLYYRDPQGKQRAKSLRTGNKRLALELKAQFDEGIIKNIFGARQQVTFRELRNLRLEHLQNQGKTTDRERKVFRVYFISSTRTIVQYSPK